MDDADQKRGADMTSATAEPVRSGLPVLPPLAAVLEILLLVVLPGLLDYFVPGFPSLNEMHPHFYWLPVVLLSAQYGSLSGLLTAGAAIMLAALLGWSDQEIGENHFSYLLRVWLQPVLWIATAVVLGQFRLRQIEQKEELGRAVQELTSQRHSIAEHARNLRTRCEHLERIIATRREPDARTLLTALGRIQSPEAVTADTALHEALRLAFGDCRAAVYVRDPGVARQLRLAARHGEAGRQSNPETIGDGQPLYGAAFLGGRALSVLNPGDERDLQPHGLAAVPIRAADQTVLGVLLLEHAAPSEIDAGTVDRLGAVAALIASRLGDGAQPGTTGRPLPAPVSPERQEAPLHRPWRGVRWRDIARRTAAIRTNSRSG